MAGLSFRELVSRLRFAGAVFLLLIAAVSLIADALIIREVWQLRQAVNTQISASVQLAQDSLTTTDNTLVVLDRQVEAVSSVATQVGAAANTTTQVIDATNQSLQSALHLLRSEMPATLDGAHAAVVSAQSAASLIDTTLAAIPFIPGLANAYNPPVPLHDSLGNLAQSLDQLPALTKSLADDLASADAALPEARRNATSVAQTLEKNPLEASQLHQNIAQYRDQVARLRQEVADVQAKADQWLTWIAIAVTFIVVWIAVFHAAIVYAALRWLR
jgi:ABC-type transporter Mla subunit MlaD